MSSCADYDLTLGTSWLIGLRDVNGSLDGSETVTAYIKRAPNRSVPADDITPIFAFDVTFLAANGEEKAIYELEASPDKTALLKPGIHAVDARIETGASVFQTATLFINVLSRVTRG